jgi:hypothetical protein
MPLLQRTISLARKCADEQSRRLLCRNPRLRIRALADLHSGGNDASGKHQTYCTPHYLVGDVVAANNPHDHLPGDNEF